MASVAIAVGVSVAAALLTTALTPKPRQSNQLDDLSILKSEYGTPIPKIFRKNRVTGNVVWSPPISKDIDFGNKGEGDSTKYLGTFAVLLCEGEIFTIGKMWLNNKLVYNPFSSDPEVAAASADFASATFTVYLGTNTQSPNATMAAIEGAGITGLTNLAYIFFHDLGLENYGNQLPKVEVEIIERDGTMTLSTLVNELLALCGLSPTQYSISLSNNPNVEGFKFANSGTSVKEALEDLQSIYFFQIIDDGSKLIIRDQEQPITSIGTITSQLTSTRLFGSDPISGYTEIIEKQEDLPSFVEIEYNNINNDYSRGVQSRYRSSATHINEMNFKTNVVMSDSTAQTAAERTLELYWKQQRKYEDINLPIEYFALQAGQSVQIDIRGVIRTAQVQKIVRGTNFIAQATILSSPGNLYLTTSNSGSSYNPSNEITLLGNPEAILVDAPMVTDQSSTIGCYATARKNSVNSSWTGGSLFTSLNDSAYVNSFNISITGAHGTLAQASGLNRPNFRYRHSSSAIKVVIPFGSLTSVTEGEFQNFANVLSINQELITFKNAVLTGTNVSGHKLYDITDYVRGIRGTDKFVANHASGSGVHLVRGINSLTDITLDTTVLNQKVEAKAVPNGFAEPDATIETTINPFKGQRLVPYAPTRFKLTLNSSTQDLEASWLRRTRIGGEWVSASEIVILSEVNESYQVDIMNPLGTAVLATHFTTTPSYTLTLAEQLSLFGSAQLAVWMRIFQQSALVGNGTPYNTGFYLANRVL